jgi:hypothetical protein
MFNFDRIDRQMRNFNEMVAKLGIDPVDLARDCLGYRLTTAIRRCAACDASQACLDWLSQAESPAKEPPAFCPNADIFALARRKPAEAA